MNSEKEKENRKQICSYIFLGISTAHQSAYALWFYLTFGTNLYVISYSTGKLQKWAGIISLYVFSVSLPRLTCGLPLTALNKK